MMGHYVEQLQPEVGKALSWLQYKYHELLAK